MMRNIKFIIICTSLFILCSTSLLICDEQVSDSSDRWDLKMIKEAHIWQYLLVNYGYANHSLYWPERKKALQKVMEEFPDSRWADDAMLLLAGGQASVEGDINGAIALLKKIIHDYPTENTIVTKWDSEIGCHLSQAWLMYAPHLAFLNQDRSIRASNPFDSDGEICVLEKEILNYFNHLEKYPIATKDVARYLIALMHKANGNNSGAISELESMIAGFSEFSRVNIADRKAAEDPFGRFIACEPPSESSPIWRVQFAAYISLIELYKLNDMNDQALNVGLSLATICSADSWRRDINSYVGDMFAKNGRWDVAVKQYELALQATRKLVVDQAPRLRALYEAGNLMKPKGFISWEEQALKSEVVNIEKLEVQLKEARSKQ